MPNRVSFLAASLALLFAVLIAATAIADSGDATYNIRIDTRDRFERTRVVGLGIAIDHVDLATGASFAHVTDADARRIERLGFVVTPIAAAGFPFNMQDYHDESEVNAALDQLALDHPDIVHLFSIGTSVEGRDLRAVRVSDNAATYESGEPAVFFGAEYHAREYVSVEVPLDFLNRLVTGYGVDEFVTYLINEREIYVVPRVNPDGHTYDVEANQAWWRKNRVTTGNPVCKGVDLNRNFASGFGGDPGSSGDPCQEIYRGPSAFSEPETAAVRDFLLAYDNVTLSVDLHTYGGLILYPWSKSFEDIIEPDHTIHRNAALRMAGESNYTAQPSSDLYISAGTACDWAYDVAGKVAFTYEMTGEFGGGDFYPNDNILPLTFNKMWPVMLFATAISADPSMVLSADIWRQSATADGGEVVTTWSPLGDDPGGTYSVWRMEGAAADYTQVSPNLTSGEFEYEYIDQTVAPDTTYTYQVRFYGPNGNAEFDPMIVTTDATADDDAADDDAADDDAADDDASDDDASDDDAMDDDFLDDDVSDDDVSDDDVSDDDAFDDDAGADDDVNDDDEAPAPDIDDDDDAANADESGDSGGCGC
ncbi:zinc carboxypeptidase [bacterium]|nr:zinc carboxypeptidase [bacterium]